MQYRWIPPDDAGRTPSWIWIYLHGASSSLADGAAGFEVMAATAGAHLLLPQATRPVERGFMWSFAADGLALAAVIEQECNQRGLGQARVAVIAHSMGCTMALWLLRQLPGRIDAVAALGMGSAFEHWEGDDGGFAPGDLAVAARGTRILLAVDARDPAGSPPHVAGYFAANLARLSEEGFPVETYRPNRGTHAVTDEMRQRVRSFLQAV
jgi:pimeloyl-ACP methyl ester carboxylesterase